MPATQADQSTIESLIRQAKINPRNLHWEHFRIAEEDGQIVGIRQVSRVRRTMSNGILYPIGFHRLNEFARQYAATHSSIA